MYIKKIAHKTLSRDIFYTEMFFLLKERKQQQIPPPYSTQFTFITSRPTKCVYSFPSCLPYLTCWVALTYLLVEQKCSWPKVTFLCQEHESAENPRQASAGKHVHQTTAQKLGFFPGLRRHSGWVIQTLPCQAHSLTWFVFKAAPEIGRNATEGKLGDGFVGKSARGC